MIIIIILHHFQRSVSSQLFQKLKKFGYSKVILQTGRGEFVPDVSVCEQIPGLVVEYFQFKSSIKENIESADLVISHAGVLFK